MGTPPAWVIAATVIFAAVALGIALYHYVLQGSRKRELHINNEVSRALGRMVRVHLVESFRVEILPTLPCPDGALLGTWVLRSELCQRNGQPSVYTKAYGRTRGRASESVLVVHDHPRQEWVVVVFGAIPPKPKCTTNVMAVPVTLLGPLCVGPLDK